MPSSLLELFGVLSDHQNQISNQNLVSSPLLNALYERDDTDTLFRVDRTFIVYCFLCSKNSALIIR